jgi:hypothetical protein
MIKWFTSLRRRFVGRINKMKVVRDLILIVFALFFAYLAPALSELLNTSNWAELDKLFQANTILPYLLMMPFVVLGLMLFFIHKIDKWEDDKAEKRHKELLEAIQNNPLNNSVQELINEIRQDRNERKNKPKQ